MTTYYVDPKNGCNKYDGLTTDTAFATKEFAEYVLIVKTGQCFCEKCEHDGELETLFQGNEEDEDGK